MATDTPYTIDTLRVGEIFEYSVEYYDEDEKKNVTVKNRAFFIKVDDLYYLIKIDEEDGSYLFFGDLMGFQYKGKQRIGEHPFTHIEALKYIKARKVRATGKFIVERKNKAIKKLNDLDEYLKGKQIKKSTIEWTEEFEPDENPSF